jgi:DNA polymerase elongation subunit (family B)
MKLEDGRKPVVIKAMKSLGACFKAYKILELLSPDFDLEKIAAHLSGSKWLGSKMEKRRLGSSGSGFFWRLLNGTNVNSMYDIGKYLQSNWSSISLASIANELSMLNKLNIDNMMVENKDSYDTKMPIYNVRDSDLHALVFRTIKTCDRLFALAGASSSTSWDAITGSSGIMVYGCTALVAMSVGKTLDMSLVTASDEMSFEGGFALAPKAGCHKGVVVVDGNSLYGTIMSELGIYIDTCASSKTLLALVNKMLIPKLGVLKRIDVDIGDTIESGSYLFMRDKESYMCVKKA